MNWFRRILAFIFGGVFAYAGVMKLRDPGLFLVDIRSFDLLPDPYAAWLALVLPWIEVTGGLAVVTGFFRRGALLVLNGLLLVFFVAIGSAWFRGLDIQCGCFGSSGSTSNYVELFARDGILLAIGLALGFLARQAGSPKTNV